MTTLLFWIIPSLVLSKINKLDIFFLHDFSLDSSDEVSHEIILVFLVHSTYQLIVSHADHWISLF